MKYVSLDTRIADKIEGMEWWEPIGHQLLTCGQFVQPRNSNSVVKFSKFSKEAEHSKFYVKSV